MELDIYDVQGLFPKADYLRGLQYYHENRVKGLRWIKDQQLVSCYVPGTQSYQVSFREVAPGRLDGRCSCPRFADVGYCKHLAAAMIAFVFDPPTDKPPVTDRYAQALLRSYLNRNAPVEADSGDFRLIPQPEKTYYSEQSYPAFSFRVGREKTYVVKDIKAFLQNVENRKVVSYGKALTLDHSIENFDEASKAWIHLLMDQYEECFRSGGARISGRKPRKAPDPCRPEGRHLRRNRRRNPDHVQGRPAESAAITEKLL